MRKLLLILIAVGLTTSTQTLGQTTVFTDDFSTSHGEVFTTSGQIGTSGWFVTRSGDDFGARIHNDRMELTNTASAEANANGWVFSHRDAGDFAAPFETILEDNTEIVSWSFNMRQIRTNPSGFGSNRYGVAVVIGSTHANVGTEGSGYAVVLGGTGTTNPIRFVRFSGGINTLATSQDGLIVASAPLDAIGNDYLSIRLTYDPRTHTWELFGRNDGSASFQDPDDGTLTSVGSVVDDEFTETSLDHMGGFWHGATALNQTAFVDNVSVRTAPPPAGPEITHTPLGNTTSTDARTAVATITGNDLITVGDDRPVLWYRVDGGGWNSTYFTNQTDDDFEFTIPGQAASSTVEYYIAARDEDDVTTDPLGGSGTEPPGSTPPETFHSYTVEMVATHLAFVDFPGMGFTDEPVATFTVEARRDDDAADPNYTDNVTLTKQSGPGNVTGTLIVAAVDGVATFDDVAFDEAGTYTLVATAPDVDPDVSSEIEIQVAPEPPVIIAYWHFNDEDLSVSAGQGTMTSTVEPANQQFFAGSSINAAFGHPAGDAFSPQGGPDEINNGRNITWVVSTQGYEGILVSWAQRGTSTGFSDNTFQYSTDGGANWNTFESGIDATHTTFALKEFDLRAIEGLDDNPDAQFRLILDGATFEFGNNRYDNVRISGSPIVDEEDEQFVDSPGEYDFAGTDVSMNFTDSGTEGDVTVKLFGTGTAGRAPEGVLTFSSNRFWRITSDKTGFTTDVTFTLDPGEDEFDPSEFADEDVVMLHRANADDQWEKWPRDNTEWNTEGIPPTFEITAQSVTDFSEWVVGIAETALPIDLASFDAAVDGRDALLTWQTASETNNAGFHIQRRTGESFADVGFVEGAGTDPEGRAYSYRVEDLSPGTHSFRLRQVDFDGGVSYSSVLEVTVELAEAYELTAAYPNPFNPQTSFKLTVAQEQHVTIEVYDVLGRRVATLHDGLMPANETQTFTFSGGTLSSGLYLYRVEGETFSQTRRMTLLK